MKRIIITEQQEKMLNSLLTEDRASKNVSFARRYLVSNGYSQEKAQQVIDSIRHDIPNVRLAQYKFILGVTRMYLDNQLQSGHEIGELNKTLKYVASDAHVNEYNYDLNGEDYTTLIGRFKGVVKSDLESDMAASNARQLTVNQDYNIIPIDNAEEAAKYGKYTSWCVTHQSNMYDSYTANGLGRFYFCLHKGFETEPKVKGQNAPLDSYGLSMIAVSVDMEGAVNTITCRWNHDMGGNDSIMTVEELEQILGRNFYQTFKPYSREELHAKGIILFDEVQELLDSGKNPEEIFTVIYDADINGIMKVMLYNKYNFINSQNKLISKQWFDGAFRFQDGFARVELNNKYNYINQEGRLISNQWFDDAYNFNDEFAKVELNGKYNYINTEGKYLSNQWFDFVSDFYGEFAKVGLNGKYNYINQEGRLISNQWFDNVGDFNDEFARVELNDKYNFINQEGRLISNQWFDYVYNFNDGFAIVELNDKYNYINQEGRLISNQWFDNVGNFNDGFARVKLNGKYNFINTEGEIVESKKSNKTIIITEKQKKKLKKAIAAQDQVGGKVNAGVMDAVVGGMCEDATEDKFVLGAEMNAPIGGVYHHVVEEKLNESPDSFASEAFNIDGCYPFIKLKYNNTFYIGEMRETHYNLVKRLISTGEINDEVFKEDFLENYLIKPYDYFFDDTMTGRYWGKYNVISFWKTPINIPSKIQKVVDLLQQEISINTQYLLIDYWDNNGIWDSEIPYKWLFNGTYNIFKGRFMQISPAKPMEYVRRGKYEYFRINTKERGIQYATLDGDILMPMEYFQQTSVNESVEKNDLNINDIIYSDNFKRWFGDWQNNPENSSKVIDENGLPLIVHHGSPKFIGDKFNKSYIGKSMNIGEGGVFCTTQDMDWAKRFSYPASQGSTSFSVKLDTSKQGDILSGFLNIRHPLNFFNLTEEDYNNMWQMVIETKKEQGFDNWEDNKKKWFDECQELLKIGNHQLIKFDLCGGWRNFGEILKQYGYDGYIAKMNPKDSAVEYCFIGPNQFKSIKSFGFNPESESIYESNNKDIRVKEEKTDFGKVLYFNSNNNSFKFALYQYDDEPDVLYLANVSVNKSHRKNGLGNNILSFVDNFANKINASAILLKVKKDSFMFEWYKRNGYKYHSDADSSYVWMIKKMKNKTSVIEGKKKIIKNDKGEVVPEKCDKCGGKVALQIHGEPVYLCKDCGKYFGTMPFSLKEGKLNESFESIYDVYDDYQIYDLLSEFEKDKRNGITVKQWNLIPAQQYHTLLKRYMASPEMARIPYNVVYNWFMTVVKNAISIEYITQLAGHSQFFPVDDVMDYFGKEINDYDDGSEYLESIGFYDWCKLPDGTDAWSDYGLKPLFKIINEYKPNASAEEILILINRCLDVVHWRGDLSSAFIQGGKKSCDYISNLKESIDYSKWLKQLKKRRDPGNIEENVENELSSSEVDLSSFNIKKKLNPEFWVDAHLDSRIRMKLLDIADDFIETLGISKVKPVDVIMTGSLANFNWNKKYSDIDLHVVYDYNDIDDNKDFIKEYFDSKKQLWNQKHKDLTIYGFNVELYVQDANEEHASSGVYSIEKDKWLIEPDRDTLATSKVNKEYIKDKASYYATKIDELCYQFKKAKDDEYKIRKISEKAEKLFDEIKKMRKTGFEKSGGKEINSFNIIFKYLKRYGYLEKLSNLKVKSYDKLQGI